MDNWINLDNLPRRDDGKIDWKRCNHNLVRFNYRGNEDVFYIEDFINQYSVNVLFRNQIYQMNIESIKRVCLGKLYGFAVSGNYKYHKDDVVESCNRHLKILEQTRIHYNNGKDSKGYIIGCIICDYTYIISEVNLVRGDGCPHCSGHQIVSGTNDLYTKRPDIVAMLKNKEDARIYGEFSNQLSEFVCPHCNVDMGEHFIHNVTRFGLSCPSCGRGISFPNRLMKNLLLQLNEPHETEIKFDWCIFQDFSNPHKVSYGRYDFIIEHRKLIIEMDGGLGHGNDPHPKSRYSKEELIYRDQMKDKLAIDNGYNIIRINCNYTNYNRFDYIKNNIINSVLSDILPINQVDWTDLYAKCC